MRCMTRLRLSDPETRLLRLLELRELVLDLPDLLLRQVLLLLVLLELLLKVLDGLLLLLVRQRLVALDVDLVARGIEDLLLLLVLLDLLIAIIAALGREVASVHDPLLRRDAVAEIHVMADNNNTAVVLLNRLRERAERVAIEVIRRLIDNQHMRVLPRELRVDTEILQVLLNARRRQHLVLQTLLGGDLLILTLDLLLVAHLDELLAGDPRERVHRHALPLALVLLGLLLVAALRDAIELDRDLQLLLRVVLALVIKEGVALLQLAIDPLVLPDLLVRVVLGLAKSREVVNGFVVL